MGSSYYGIFGNGILMAITTFAVFCLIIWKWEKIINIFRKNGKNKSNL